MKILIGTGNEGKFREIGEVLSSLPITLINPKTIGIQESPEESGKNYEENAIIKADFYYKKSGLTTLAEDSGIEIEALPGELGFQTRRWGKGEKVSDEEWFEHFLEKIKKLKNRKATFHCTAALIFENKKHIFHGECHGHLLTAPSVPPPKGIPISSIFVPENMQKVYATLTPEEKSIISHRGRAIHQAKLFLEKNMIIS